MENDIDLIKKQLKDNIQQLVDAGDLKEAKQLIEQYKNITKDDSEAYSMDAVILIMEGKLEQAEQVLREGLNIDEDNFDLNYNLGYTYEKADKFNLALECYEKARSSCNDEKLQEQINSTISVIKDKHPEVINENRLKLIFFVKQGMDSFLGNIINGLSDEYITKKVIVTDYKQIDKGIKWADICWFEWCDELVIYGSKLPMASEKKIICRLHRYEVFTNYPKQVNWNNVDKLIIVAKHLLKLLKSQVPNINEQVNTVTINNGVDLDKFKFKQRKRGFNIAYVGYIHARKNPVLLLQIINMLVKKDKRYKLFVAGEFQDSLIKLYWNDQINKMKLNRNVIFQGWQSDIGKWLENKNYVLSTSIHESFGYGIAEAMARGIKPIIHNFLFAEEVWNKKYLFNDISEAVDMITNNEYNSEEYRKFIEDNYSLIKAKVYIKKMFSKLNRIKFSGNIKNIKTHLFNKCNNKIGIVIPIYKINFINSIIKYITDTCKNMDYIICIVNDGKENVRKYLINQNWDNNVEILNLRANKCFAGANNFGWKYLINKYPDIEYLCTINDDTIPKKGWLEELLISLKKYPKVALAAPIMITKNKNNEEEYNIAEFRLKNYINPLEIKNNYIDSDKFVAVVAGFCFVAKRQALKEVGFFDERFKNSCEDVDLCLKLISNNWRIVVCKNSNVFHYGGMSRYDIGTNTDIIFSHNILKEKWGENLSKYNYYVRPKTAVHCCAFNQEHFIKAWVKNASNYADEIIVMYSRYPWNYNVNARQKYNFDKTGKILDDLLKDYPQLIIVEGEWSNETDQRNDALKIAKIGGNQWFLIVDTDEFYEENKILNVFKWMLKNQSQMWIMSHVQLIKQINWSIETPKGKPNFQFAIDLNKVKKFINKRIPETTESRLIPENICVCWHLSYLMPFNKLLQKLDTFGHAHQISQNWIAEVWPKIKPGIKNFHPVWPEEWKGIKEVEIPDFLNQNIDFIKPKLVNSPSSQHSPRTMS